MSDPKKSLIVVSLIISVQTTAVEKAGAPPSGSRKIAHFTERSADSLPTDANESLNCTGDLRAGLNLYFHSQMDIQSDLSRTIIVKFFICQK